MNSRFCLPRRRLLGRFVAVVAVLSAMSLPGAVHAAQIPEWLPRYDLDIQLDIDGHLATCRQQVTYTNHHDAPTTELVFNVHSHYEIPDSDIGFLAKMGEILRFSPSQSMDFNGPPCKIQSVQMISELRPVKKNNVPGQIGLTWQIKHDPEKTPDNGTPRKLDFHWKEDNSTAMVVPLPAPLSPGESVTVELAYTIRLPQKMGRWGQWKGVTFLTNSLPVLAFYDDKKGWQPTPFIPWHLPWFNEAGVYHVSLTLPEDQKVACTGTVTKTEDLGDGRKHLEISTAAARDFALITSSKFVEIGDKVGDTLVKVLALPEHQDYAQRMLKSITDALPIYTKWFGPYPAPEFTLVESYFGWLGNECGGLVMIDERVFDAPQLAHSYVDYLVTHEFCHMWFYNAIGTNGFAETWMAEGFATYFAHRVLDGKEGHNNPLLDYPKWLCWLPQIYRENYRYYGLYGAIGRGAYGPTVQDMPKYTHLVNLMSMTYDKGSKVVGMIEDKMGEAAFFDFMHVLYDKYYYKVCRVADFEQELEDYTGHSWEPFFKDWVYGKAITDWAIEKVTIGEGAPGLMQCLLPKKTDPKQGVHVSVLLHQKGDCTEPTVLGICMKDDGCDYQIRIPIALTTEHVELEDPPAEVTTLPDNRVRVDVTLPAEPKQMAVDPDQVLIDRNPANNYWKCWCHWRLTPLYTSLDETDLTNDYDKWNFIAGPWLYLGPAYTDPWFTRMEMFGFRADAYRTQQFDGGVYSAYRYDYRDIVVGADGLWSHFPIPEMQAGFIVERRVDAFFGQSDEHASRAVLYSRYVLDYSSSLYLPPMQYVEAFTTYQDNFLPTPTIRPPGAEAYTQMETAGLHYQLNYLTPYWNPEGGFFFDAAYSAGAVRVNGAGDTTQQLTLDFSTVKTLPESFGIASGSQVACHLFGAAALPDKVEFFPLGGDERFRGYDIQNRQGNMIWVGSLEWRVPVATGLTYSCLDHIIGLRNIILAPFYDVGAAYVSGHQIGDVAQDVGLGFRLDVSWFSFVERSILRLDVAKTINDNAPVQVWLGIQHPF